jgi:hypothetical protein
MRGPVPDRFIAGNLEPVPVAVEPSISKAKQTKKRRGERARKRWRSHPGRHDLREQYREGDLPSGGLAVVSFEDPYEQAAWPDTQGMRDVTARLRQVRHVDGSVALGMPAWEPPHKPRVTAVANLHGDVLARLRVRRQISEPQFLAGRRYQAYHDDAAIGSVHSVRLDQSYVSGSLLPDPMTDRQRVAAARLRAIEAAVRKRNGAGGIWMTRMVLAEHHSPEAVARTAGAGVRMCCRLLYQCLTTIAVATGFMTSTRQPYRPEFVDGRDPAEDPGRHAAAGELMDPRLRRGRVNGHS